MEFSGNPIRQEKNINKSEEDEVSSFVKEFNDKVIIESVIPKRYSKY